MSRVTIVQAGSSPVKIDVGLPSLGVGWNQLELGVTNNTGVPVVIGLRYEEGPADTIYAHLEGGANLSWVRGESNEIGLVMTNAFTLKLMLYLPLPGKYRLRLLWRKSFETSFTDDGYVELTVSGKPSRLERIDPWDERLYENMEDGKPRMVITLTGLNKAGTGDYYLYFTIYDRKTGETYSPVYLASEIVKPKSGTDNLVLSPLALQALLQLKEYSSDKYVSLLYSTSFKFNAFAEFIKMVSQGRVEDARTWFEQRIQEMVLQALRRNGIPVRGVWVNSLKLNYDVVGIVTGTNPTVTVDAVIGMTIDPAIPWWLIGVIIAGAVAAFIGYKVIEYLTINSIETTKQEYYKTLQAYAEAWAQYEKAYQEWLNNPKGSPPTPPQIPQPKPPKPPKLPSPFPSIPWGDIATILALIVGGAIAYKLLGKK